MNDNPQLSFHYKGYGREFTYTLDGEDADYLPPIMRNFAEFLRAVSFGYIGVRPQFRKKDIGTVTEYLFHTEYDYTQSDEERIEDYWHHYDEDSDDEEQDVINEAADSYYSGTSNIKKPFISEADGIAIGDCVYYNGHGTPDAQNQHHGFTGVSLKFSEGRVTKLTDSPVGKRALVQWKNWNDGHNGMGDDPDAKVGDKSYWWVNVDNLYIVNDTNF